MKGKERSNSMEMKENERRKKVTGKEKHEIM
jgi:hypothetical protein